MRLNPRHPPGRASRAARQYAHQVRRLRAEGYTLEAIREALFDAGVSVSLSTVRREANRPQSAWDLEQLSEASLSPEALASRGHRAGVPGEGVEGPSEGDAVGPFPNVMAVLRHIFRPR